MSTGRICGKIADAAYWHACQLPPGHKGKCDHRKSGTPSGLHLPGDRCPRCGETHSLREAQYLNKLELRLVKA